MDKCHLWVVGSFLDTWCWQHIIGFVSVVLKYCSILCLLTDSSTEMDSYKDWLRKSLLCPFLPLCLPLRLARLHTNDILTLTHTDLTLPPSSTVLSPRWPALLTLSSSPSQSEPDRERRPGVYSLLFTAPLPLFFSLLLSLFLSLSFSHPSSSPLAPFPLSALGKQRSDPALLSLSQQKNNPKTEIIKQEVKT